MAMIFAVRHPKPAVADATCYGRLDIGLAEPAMPSARRIAYQLPPRTICGIVSSPLRRAYDVAVCLAQLTGQPLSIDDRLMELDFGRWEGVAWNRIPRSEIDAWAGAPLDYRPGGGETPRELYARVSEAWSEAQDGASSPRLWVTHAGPLRCLHALATGEGLAASLARNFAYCNVHSY